MFEVVRIFINDSSRSSNLNGKGRILRAYESKDFIDDYNNMQVTIRMNKRSLGNVFHEFMAVFWCVVVYSLTHDTLLSIVVFLNFFLSAKKKWNSMFRFFERVLKC